MNQGRAQWLYSHITTNKQYRDSHIGDGGEGVLALIQYNSVVDAVGKLIAHDGQARYAPLCRGTNKHVGCVQKEAVRHRELQYSTDLASLDIVLW